MKSLILFSYKQPVEGSSFRWGVLSDERDLEREPLAPETIYGPYRAGDPNFQRTQHLETVLTRKGPKAFYRERQSFRVRVPFVGSLVEKLMA